MNDVAPTAERSRIRSVLVRRGMSFLCISFALGSVLSACSGLESSEHASTVDAPTVASQQQASQESQSRQTAIDGNPIAEFTRGLCYEYFNAMQCRHHSTSEPKADSSICDKLSGNEDFSRMAESKCPRQENSHDAEMARFWYRKAADDGNVSAQLSLAFMYDTGIGAAQDYKQAAEWYRKAADQGMSIAENSLGDLYAKGQGVPQDFAQALHWYQKAAEKNNDYAINNLGLMYFKGWGVPRDDFAAARWYAKNQSRGLTVESSFGRPLGFICEYGREEHPGYADPGDTAPPPDDSTLQYLSCPNHVGLINRAGKVVLPPVFDGVGSFASNGLAPVAISGRWGFANQKDRMMIAPQYDLVSEFNELGIAAVMNPDGTFDFIDSKGRAVTRQHFEQFVGDGHEELQFLRRRHPERSCCNNIVGLPRALEPVQFASGVLPARKAGLWGYINAKGKWVIPPRYDDAQPFTYKGFASVRKAEEWMYIDVHGRIISDEEWLSNKSIPKDQKRANPTSQRYAYRQSARVVAPEAYEAGDFVNGLAIVRKGMFDKWAYIDAKGETVIPPTFDCASDFDDDGLAFGQVGGESFFFDKTGKVRIRSTYPIILGFSPAGYAYIKAERGCQEPPGIQSTIE